MNADEKRALLKRQLLKETLAKENEELARQAVTPQFSRTESAVAGAGQGLGYNFLDELYGARKGVQDVLPLVGDHPISELPERYRANRDEARAYYEQAERENPGSYATGEILGGGASAFVPGYNLAGGTGKAARIGSAALSSGVAGLGASDHESALGNLEDAGLSAIVGGGLTAGLGKVGGKLSGLETRANEKAVKAAGGMTKEFRELRKKGFLDKQGKWLREKGVVTPLASLEDVSERSKTLKQNAGQIIGGIIDEADSLRGQAIEGVRKAIVGEGKLPATPEQLAKAKAVEDMINQEFGYNFNNVADRVEALIKRDENIAASKFHRDRLASLSDEFRQIAGRGAVSLRDGLRNKTEQRRLLKDVDSLGEEYKQEVYDIISDELERSVSGFERLQAGVQKMYGQVLPEHVDASGMPALPSPGALTDPAATLAPQVPGPEATQAVVDKFRAANQEYAQAATAQAMAEKRLGSTMSNRDFGLTTAIASAAGLNTAGPVGAMAAGGVNNFFRQYGSAIQANMYAKVAEVASSQPKALPQIFGKNAPMLKEALQRGPRQFVVANYIAAKRDPKAKAYLERLLGDPTVNPTGEQSAFRTTDPEMLADAREMIGKDESMSSIEKAKLLSEINKSGALEVEMEPAREDTRQPVPTLAPKTMTDLLGAFERTARS